MEWINAYKEQPIVPEGKHGVTVLAVIYDCCYEDCCNEDHEDVDGREVCMINWTGEGWLTSYLDFKRKTEVMRDSPFEVLYWMYKPELPERKLRDCQSCGASSAQVFYKDTDSSKPWSVYCNSCGNNSAEFYGVTKEEVIKKWNGEDQNE